MAIRLLFFSLICVVCHSCLTLLISIITLQQSASDISRIWNIVCLFRFCCCKMLCSFNGIFFRCSNSHEILRDVSFPSSWCHSQFCPHIVPSIVPMHHVISDVISKVVYCTGMTLVMMRRHGNDNNSESNQCWSCLLHFPNDSLLFLFSNLLLSLSC